MKALAASKSLPNRAMRRGENSRPIEAEELRGHFGRPERLGLCKMAVNAGAQVQGLSQGEKSPDPRIKLLIQHTISVHEILAR